MSQLHRYRKKRRCGNRSPTKGELARIIGSKEDRCMPCLSWALQHKMPMEYVVEGVSYDHSKSGNIRRGHDKGFGSCEWHHYGNQKQPPDGWTNEMLRARFGPSLMDGSKLFAEAYGDDDYLIELQASALAGEV